MLNNIFPVSVSPLLLLLDHRYYLRLRIEKVLKAPFLDGFHHQTFYSSCDCSKIIGDGGQPSLLEISR